MTSISPVDAFLYLTVGGVLGALYFVLLLRTVRLHASQAAALLIVPLYLLRVGLAVSTFWIIAQQGAFQLLLALLGFLIARIATQRRMRSA